MSDGCSQVGGTDNGMAFWIERSSLVQRWRAMKQDVLLHKWYESERAGRDIGWDKALVDWNIRIHPDFCRRCPH